MIEALLLWAAAWFFTIPCVVIISVLALIFEHKDHHWFTAFLLGVGGFAAYKTFGIEPRYIWYAAAAYIPIGLVWSFYRWKRHFDAVTRGLEEDLNGHVIALYGDNHSETLLRYAQEKIDPMKRIPVIVAWVLVWPISVIEMAVGDIIDAVERLVRSICKQTYARITANSDARMKKMQADFMYKRSQAEATIEKSNDLDVRPGHR